MQRGASKLEVLGIVFTVAFVLGMIPFIREIMGDIMGFFFNQRDAVTGERNDFSTALLGIAITIGAVATFIGAGYLLLWTNLGTKLAFLVVGAVTTGWLFINGILFVVFAPRGVRPADVEGLNAVQVRIPAVAMAVGSLVLFLMFLAALDRYETEEALEP